MESAGTQRCVLFTECLSFYSVGSPDRNRPKNKLQLWRKLSLDSAVGCLHSETWTELFWARIAQMSIKALRRTLILQSNEDL